MKKFGLSIFFFLVIFGVAITTIGVRLKNGLNFTRVFNKDRWEEFYKNDNEYSFLFLGSSHSYCTFIPTVFDTIIDVNSFNLSSSLQSPITSKYTLLEAMRHNSLKGLVIEVYPGSIHKRDNYMNALLNFDYIKSIDIKTKLMLTSDNYSDLLEVLLPAYRYNNYLTTFFKETPPINEDLIFKGISSSYFDKGYIKEIPLNDFKYKTKFDSLTIDRSNFSEDREKAIIDISNICKENDIKLYVVTSPLNPLYLRKIKDYEIFHNYIDSLSKKNNFEYIDGNYHPEIGIVEKDFKDSGHLFYSGAVKFSTWFANELNKVQPDK